MKQLYLLFSICFLTITSLKAQTLDVDFSGNCMYNSGVPDTDGIAQSFTSGLTGTLTNVKVGVSVGDCGSATSTGVATILSGTCNGSVLTTQAFSFEKNTDVSLRDIVFDNPPSVVAGQIYTIQLRSDSCDIRWHLENAFNCGGSYAGGKAYESGCTEFDVDYYFQTFVQPCFITDQMLAPANSNFICSGNVEVELAGSQTGVRYYLRNDLNDSIVSGPVAGNGSSIKINTGNVSSTNTFNVLAETNDSTGVTLPTETDHIRFNSPYYSYTNQITIEALVNFNQEQPWAGQSSDGIDNSGTNVWIWHAGTFYVNDNGIWRSLNFPTLIPSTWTHVATVADATGLYIYYDGQLVASNTDGISSGIVNNSSSVVDLGHDSRFPAGEPGRNSNTSFDDFRIWNVARTSSEIQANMNSCLSGTETGLVQYTLFNEGSGTTISSVKGSNGNIENPTLNWVSGSPSVCGPSCSLEMSQKITVTVDSIKNQSPTAADASFCDNGATDISISSSEVGFNYYLRQNNDNSIIDGPLAGTGGGLTFNTGLISSTTTYNVYAENAIDSTCNRQMTPTVTVTINNSSTGTDVQTACESYTWIDGNIYTANNNTATHTLSNAAGCDSIVTLNLTIQNSSATVTQSGDQLIATETGATYQWLDCDNGYSIISNETNQSFAPTSSGNYAVIVSQSVCTDTSACHSIIITNATKHLRQDGKVDVYPNPNNGTFYLKVKEKGTFSITNSIGQRIQRVSLEPAESVTITNLENGLYFITNETGTIQQKIVVVK